MTGLLLMAVVHTETVASTAFENWVFQIGSWMPNAQGIGPYSGKETFMLIGWVSSWAVLHPLLRRRDLRLAVSVAIFVVGMAVATLLVYGPFIHFILGKR